MSHLTGPFPGGLYSDGMATPAPEGLRAAFDPDNQDSEVIALFLDSPNANRILVNAFDLAAALARLEDGTDQDPFFSPMSAEGISTNTVELEGGPDPTSDYSPESSVPVEASYMAGEVETIEPGGAMLLRRVWYPGEDTLEITGPTGAVYTFDYKQAVEYLRPMLPR